MRPEDLNKLLIPLLGDTTVEAEPMAGSTSADLFALDAQGKRYVLRIFKSELWDEAPESLSLREITILTELSKTDLPVPEPVGTLPGNGVLMSWLPGDVVLPAEPDTDWLEELAGTLARIHRSSIEVPYAYESWNDVRDLAAPDWWQDPDLWTAAQSLTRAEPGYEISFIHRDYHPVNLLWEGRHITGVVDWINACMGPAGIDVAHCRLNLALMYGIETADEFLNAYRKFTPGYRHDPYWDLDDALGAMPNIVPYAPWETFGLTGLTTQMVQERIQTFMRSAVNVRLVR